MKWFRKLAGHGEPAGTGGVAVLHDLSPEVRVPAAQVRFGQGAVLDVDGFPVGAEQEDSYSARPAEVLR